MSEPLTVIAKFTAKPEFAQAVGDGLAGQLDQTRAEEGSIDYHLHRDQTDPNVWIVYENWRSRADFDAHLEMPYTRQRTRVQGSGLQWIISGLPTRQLRNYPVTQSTSEREFTAV
ncbi:putative quinol monooxygenase [Pseudomonas sp. NPDC089554]|uniref:putative quinol monooxygenase n=1 Tax=Pseudomonas sp. NPDC089554 TaxID=3390653 RepID=UPI003CFCAED2